MRTNLKASRLAICMTVLTMASAVTAQAGEQAPISAASIAPLRECNGFGTQIPGSDTCIRFSGSIRAETAVTSGRGASLTPTPGSSSFRTTLTHQTTASRASVDVRTPTAMGTFRTYTSVRTGGRRFGSTETSK